MAKAGGAIGGRRGRLNPIDAAFIATLNARPKTLAERVRPEGKAPRGQGPEYAARRTIANILDRLGNYLQDNRSFLSRYRGQRTQSRRATIARERVNQLRLAINTIEAVVDAPGDWVFKLEIVKDIRDSAAASLVN